MELATIVSLGVAVTGALAGAVSTYIALRRQRHDEDAHVLEAYHRLIDPMQEELEKLRIEVAELRRKVEHLESRDRRNSAGLQILLNQIRATGMIPHWEPDPVE